MIDDEPSLLAVLLRADANALHRGGDHWPEMKGLILVLAPTAIRGVDPRPPPTPRRGSKRASEVQRARRRGRRAAAVAGAFVCGGHAQTG